MSDTLPSASKLELAEICEGSAVHPAVETTDFYAELGTVKHRFLARALEAGRETALAEVPEKHREACAVMDLEKLPAGQPGAWAAEVAYAFDVVTGQAREIGRGIDRQYVKAGLLPTEIPGSIDLVALSADGRAAVVTDYKTGWTRVTKAQGNLQLLFAAVCASLVYGKNAARGAILYPGADGDDPYFDTGEWDAFDLDDARLRLIALGKKVIEARRLHAGSLDTGEVIEPRLVVGKHCRYCPALTSCPAQARFVQQIVRWPEDSVDEVRRQLNPHTARLVYDRIKAVRAVVERMEAMICAYAANNPVPLSDGQILGEVETSRETLDAKVAFKVIGELFGSDVATDALEPKITKAAIKRALAKHGGAVTKRMRRVLEAMRAGGGVRVKTGRKVTEHTPGVQQLEEGEEAA